MLFNKWSVWTRRERKRNVSTSVEECVSFAGAIGDKKITLWTQIILMADRRIYQIAEFRLVKEQANRKFGKVSQTWELNLAKSESRELQVKTGAAYFPARGIRKS